MWVWMNVVEKKEKIGEEDEDWRLQIEELRRSCRLENGEWRIDGEWGLQRFADWGMCRNYETEQGGSVI